MVDENDSGEGEGDGDVVLDPPPAAPFRPLPKWLQNAVGMPSATSRKAGAVPWSAQALCELCGPDEPLFYDPTKAYVTWMLILNHGGSK